MRDPDAFQRGLRQAFMAVMALVGAAVAGQVASLLLVSLLPSLGMIAFLLVIYLSVFGKWRR